MSHLNALTGYGSLIERLNRFPQGAPPSELLVKILALLLSDKEAAMVSLLPMRPFSAARAANLWGVREVEAARLLEDMSRRALLLDSEQDTGEKLYVLPPPMRGFLEYSLMKARDGVDQKALSLLLFQYLDMERDFVRALFTEGKTRPGRVFVDEEQIPPDRASRVLDFERASAVIRGARRIGLGTCSCRQKMHHLGRGCSAPLEACFSFDGAAEALTRHGYAREINAQEALEILKHAREQNLVQYGENVQGGVSFICNCCSCCCQGLAAARKQSAQRPVQSSSYLARIKSSLCSGCGRCLDACPAEAVGLVSANSHEYRWQRKAVLAPARCLGCGLCVRACKSGALALAPRQQAPETPPDSAHRIVLMALERGKLQHLIWDNPELLSHRVFASLAGALFGMPSVQQALAKSKFWLRHLADLTRKHANGPHLEKPRRQVNV